MIILILIIWANLGSFLFLWHYQSMVSRHCVHVTETFLPDHSLLSMFPKMSNWTMLPQLKWKPYIKKVVITDGNYSTYCKAISLVWSYYNIHTSPLVRYTDIRSFRI